MRFLNKQQREVSMKTKSLNIPQNLLKKLPNTVVFAIVGSEFRVRGKVDWSKMIILDPVVTRHAEVGHTFKDRVSDKWFSGLPENLTLAVVNSNGKEEPWEITFRGLDYATFVAEDLFIGRNDELYWFYIMAQETDHLLPDNEIVFQEAWGYLAPIFRFIKGDVAKIAGRRPIAVEVAGAGGYIGSVTPGVRFHNGQWEVLVQKDKNVSPTLVSVETKRVVRFSVDNPDRPSAPEHGIGYPMNVVDLYPDFIASGRAVEKGRVKNLVYEYTDGFVPPEGQEFVPLMDIIHFADLPGFSALYQWMVFRFAEFLGQIEGMNEDLAQFEADHDVSYGPKTIVHVVRHKHTWTVLTSKDLQGRFARDGTPIPSVSCDVNTKTVGDPVKVHRLPSINNNNKRVAGSEKMDGLIPVEVWEYDSDADLGSYEERTLCDFSSDGVGPAQGILFLWMLWVYGDIFSNLKPLAK